MPSTLDLDPEWGAIDLIVEVEAAFGIKIEDAEAEQCWTVGDLYEVVCRHTSSWESKEGSCASSAVFYRVRSVVSPNDRRAVSPRTPLLDVSEAPPSRLMRDIGRGTGLRLPMIRFAGIGKVGAWLICGAVAGLLAALIFWSWRVALAAAVLFIAGVVGVYIDKGRFPSELNTVGDLVRRTAALNVTPLRESGARPVDRWDVLTALCAEYGVLQPSQIGPGTFLLRKGMEIATARA